MCAFSYKILLNERKIKMLETTGIGNLTKDPVMGKSGDIQYCNFTIAINNRSNEPSYVNVVAFNKQAQACGDYLQKGSQVMVKGIPDVDPWIDKEGNARANLKIKAKEVEFLSRTKEKGKEMSNIDRAMQKQGTSSSQSRSNNHNQHTR